MNKRIQELIEQCTDVHEMQDPETGITHTREFFDKQKFAELLINECGKLADDEEWCWNQIGLRQHFGLE